MQLFKYLKLLFTVVGFFILTGINIDWLGKTTNDLIVLAVLAVQVIIIYITVKTLRYILKTW